MDKRIVIGVVALIVVVVMLVAYFLGRRSGRKSGGGQQNNPGGMVWSMAKNLTPWGRAWAVTKIVLRVLIVVASIGSLVFLGYQVAQWDGWSRFFGDVTCAQFYEDWWATAEGEGWDFPKPSTTKCKGPEGVPALLGRLSEELDAEDWTAAAGVAESLEFIGGFYPERKEPTEFVRRLQTGGQVAVAATPTPEGEAVASPTPAQGETPQARSTPTPGVPDYVPPVTQVPAPAVVPPQQEQVVLPGEWRPCDTYAQVVGNCICSSNCTPGTGYSLVWAKWKEACTPCDPVVAVVDDLLGQFGPTETPTSRPTATRALEWRASPTPTRASVVRLPTSTPIPATPVPAAVACGCNKEFSGQLFCNDGCRNSTRDQLCGPLGEYANLFCTTGIVVYNTPTPAPPTETPKPPTPTPTAIPTPVVTPTRLPPGPPLASPTPIPCLPNGVLCGALGPGGIDQCSRCCNGSHLEGTIYHCGP